MKRKIIVLTALVLSIVLVSLTSSDQAAKAQQGRRTVGDTGIITLGPNQVLRLTADFDLDGDVDGADFLVFRRIEYSQGACSSSGVCKLTVASQTTTNPVTLMPNEAAFADIDVGSASAVRVMVLSNRRNVRVNVMIIDTVTGRITAVDSPPVNVDLLG